MTYRKSSFGLRGFTLIEMIMVITITGIISAIVAVFIKQSADSYLDAVRRAELTDAADISLRQFAREVRLALPNSLRFNCTAVPGTCYIEFIPTLDGGLYRADGDGSTAGNVLDFSGGITSCAGGNNLCFDVIGPSPATLGIGVDDYIAVFNLGTGYNPANAYNYAAGTDACGAGGCNIARVSAVAGALVTLTKNPFSAQSPPLPSPNNRFQIVSGAQQAVTYECPDAAAGAGFGTMTKRWGYGFLAAQPTAFGALGGSSATVLTNVRCEVDYTPNVLQRNGLLYVRLTIGDANENISVFQQIHVDNTP